MCKIYAKNSAAIGYSFRCHKNKNHEKTLLTNSYFKHGNDHPQDVLLFIRCYLIRLSNVNCCSETAIGQDTGGWKSITVHIYIICIYIIWTVLSLNTFLDLVSFSATLFWKIIPSSFFKTYFSKSFTNCTAPIIKGNFEKIF